VEIQEDFRDVLRFLWVDEDFFQSSFNWKNFLKHLVTYPMKVVPFGLNASPFLLNVVIRKQASLCKDTYPKEAEILDKSMYVDDLTVGADTEEELIQLSSNLNLILSKAKLPLVKWITSSPTVSTSLHQQSFEMREETEQDLPITKILGLCWEPNMDLIKYDKYDKQDFRRCTKRHLCSLLVSVFDPLGLLASALLELKLLMQRTWVEDIGWVEVLSEEYQSRIANWRQFFEKILCLEFPRWVEGQLPEPEEEKRSSAISNVVNLVIEDSDFELELARQSFWFSPDLRAIAEEGKVHKSSKICKYRPFKDNKEFLRLGGRLDQALLTSEEKHPIFLHHSSRLTKLLILDVHLQLKHGEVSEVLFHMRKKFWILRDRRTTFHRANLELKTWGTLLSSSHISRFFSDKGIRWSFIAPLAPNWGGVWERLVNLVKDKLRRVLRQDTCSLNVLDMHCKEISSIINSRPLVYVTESDGNEFALTPEHFLTGNIPK
uniref:Reverse transcriptase domain-containing protein n=1 Tax=Strigamia maritima TaxID=126957 RepID=T1J6C6_STRMM